MRIVFVGIGAAFLWSHFLDHFPQVDFVVMGEGEYTFLRLIQYLDAGEMQKIEPIEGLAYRKNGRVIRNENAEPIGDLDQLPIPAQYFGYQHVSLTRGCAARCDFCGSPQFWGRQVRFHSANYFVEQLSLLAGQGIRFFSRLALTFQKGDYAGIDAIAHRDRIAERLYQRSLEYGANARAYWGLGILYQQRQDFVESIQILTAGIKAFPKDEQLNLCMAVNYMNMEDYQKALSYLSELQHLKEAVYFTAKCYQALDDVQKAARYPEKYKSMKSII